MSLTVLFLYNKQENNIYFLTLVLAKLCTEVNLEIVMCH